MPRKYPQIRLFPKMCHLGTCPSDFFTAYSKHLPKKAPPQSHATFPYVTTELCKTSQVLLPLFNVFSHRPPPTVSCIWFAVYPCNTGYFSVAPLYFGQLNGTETVAFFDLLYCLSSTDDLVHFFLSHRVPTSLIVKAKLLAANVCSSIVT